MFSYFIILLHILYLIQASSSEIYPSDEDFILLDNNQNIKTNIKQTIKIDNLFRIDDEFDKFDLTMDGSGETTESTTELSTTYTQTQTLTSKPTDIILSNLSIFRISIDCSNAQNITTNILDQFNQNFTYPYQVIDNRTSAQCPKSSTTSDVFFTFFTDNNISILTNLVQVLANVVSSFKGIRLYSINRCGNGETSDLGLVNTTVDSCYLINLCSLCGTNPVRGVCIPQNNVSRCECFANTENPMISYTDEFCRISKDNSISSNSSSWEVIVIAVLSGFIGLLIIIVFVFLLKVYRSRRSQEKTNDVWSLSKITDRPFFENLDILRDSYDPIHELDAIIGHEDSDEVHF